MWKAGDAHTAIADTVSDSEEPNPGSSFCGASALCRCSGFHTLVWNLAKALCEGFSSPHRNPNVLPPHDSPEPTTHPNLCGIDHEALNKQIMEYKRKKEKGLLSMSLAPPSGLGLGPGPGPELTLLPRRKKARSRQNQDTSPRSFLLGDEDEDEDEDGSADYECQAHKAEEEWEAAAGGDREQQGFSGKREQG